VLLEDLWNWDGRRWALLAAKTGVGMLGHQLFADGVGNVFTIRGSGRTARWNGQVWTTVLEDSSLRRFNAAGAWDSRRRRYVLYGGKLENPDRIASDTWEFDGTRWAQVAVAGPPPLWMASMVYDAKRGVTVLFGGRDTAVPRAPRGETWEWNGTTWTQVAANGPPARSSAGMAYDTRRGEAVLFAGMDSVGRPFGDTWLWNGRTWRRANTAGPSSRQDPLMAFDASRGVTVLFGGAGTTAPTLGDTWEWDGKRWREITP
jgi:hypothetical protein